MAADPHHNGEPPEPVIEFQNISYRIGQTPFLHNLNLSVRRGETLILLGRSGSGKTTTLKLINRLLEPREGTLLVEGRPAAHLDPIKLRPNIRYVILEVWPFPHFTVV